MEDAVRPEWPADGNVVAFTTTRTGGVSRGHYSSLNLATHVGDAEDAVAENRRRLVRRHDLPHAPHWPVQIHGTRVARAAELVNGSVEADAVYTSRRREVCAILTADCLPIVLVAPEHIEAAVVHAGWRGLANGIVSAALSAFTAPPSSVHAWIGPGVGVTAYEVDGAFRDRFVHADARLACAFAAIDGRTHADLGSIAARQLTDAGVGSIGRYAGCTAEDTGRFFSYRRDRVTGRMATVVWLE